MEGKGGGVDFEEKQELLELRFLRALTDSLQKPREESKLLLLCLTELNRFFRPAGASVFLWPGGRSKARKPFLRRGRLSPEDPRLPRPGEYEGPGRSAGFAATGLREGGRVVGEIVLHRAERDFAWRERELLRRVGTIVSRELSERRAERVSRVEDRIRQKILRELRPQDLFYQILTGIKPVVGYNVSASLMIFDRERQRMVVEAEKVVWRREKSKHVGRGVALSSSVISFLGERREPTLARCLDGVWQGEGPEVPRGMAESLLPARESGRTQARCLLAAPLGWEEIMGLLLAWGDDPYLFSEHEALLLGRFAPLAAVAVRRARRSEHRERELEAIRSIGEVAGRLAGPKQLGQHILRQALEVLGVSLGSIELWDDHAGELRTLSESGHGRKKRSAIRPGEGIVGKVAATGEPILVEDVSKDPTYVRLAPHIRSELAVPLKYRDRCIGVLNVESSVCGRFGEQDLRFLTILAAQAAGALKASEFYRGMMKRVAEGRNRMKLLQRVGSLLGETAETDSLLEGAARETRRWLRSQEAAVYVYRQGRLRRAAASGEPPAEEAGSLVRVGQGLTGRAAKPDDRAPFGQVVRENRPPAKKDGGLRMSHLLAVPLRTGERLLGVLRVVNRVDGRGRLQREGFVREDEESLISIASQVAVALSGHLRRGRLMLLYQVESALQEVRDSDRALQEVADLVTGPLVGYQAVSFRLVNKFQELETRAASGGAAELRPVLNLSRREGIAARTLLEEEPVFVPRVAEEREYRSGEWARRVSATSLLCLPLRTPTGTIGTMSIYSAEEYRFPPDERSFLATLARHVALAVENLELYGNLERLREAGEALLSPQGLGEMLHSVMAQAGEALASDPVVLYQYVEEEDRFVLPPLAVGELVQPGVLDEPVTESHAAGRLVRGGRSVFLADLSTEPPDGFARRERIASAARILLRAGEEVVGVLFLNFRHPRAFTPRGKGLIDTFASQAALAIKTSRLVEARTRQVERLATYVRSAPVAIVESDRRRTIMFANEAAGKMLGAVVGGRLGEKGEASTRVLRPGELEEMFRSARETGLFAGEFVDRRLTEDPRYLYLSCTPLAGSEGGGDRYLIVGRDLTELRHLQQQATLAELARGVAHDVNNALGAVIPLVEAAREDLERGRGEREELVRDLREVERYVGAARRVFGGMLRVSRERGFRRQPVDLNDVIRSTLELLQGRLAQRSIESRPELVPGLPRIAASPIALEQVFLNLVDNAVQAMPRGGALRVRTQRADGGVAAFVEDTGVGIREEDLPRVFEPFFTTKEGNTGLGLASCRALVWEFGGKMDIRSRPGEGTTVRLWFPEEERVGAREEPPS